MQPQKLVTTEAVNALGEKVRFRACSRPTKEAEAIYRALGMRPAPFIKVKICSTQEPPGWCTRGPHSRDFGRGG